MCAKSDSPARNRLAESAYLSLYSFAGAPSPHSNTDPYTPLRARAPAALEAMGYDPETMTERGVVWAEDQDPFGHVMQSQYMHYFGNTFHCVMESYSKYLSEREYDDMVHARSVLPRRPQVRAVASVAGQVPRLGPSTCSPLTWLLTIPLTSLRRTRLSLPISKRPLSPAVTRALCRFTRFNSKR